MNDTNPIIVAICGKSSSGKDSLLKYFINNFNSFDMKINKIVSDTTRPKRIHEKQLEDYCFIKLEKFLWKRKHHRYLEWTNFRKWYYAVDKNQIKTDEINIGVFDIKGIRQLYQKKNSYNIIVIYVDDNIIKRLYRSIKREHKFRFEFIRRTYADHKDFSDIRTLLSKFKYRLDLSKVKTIENRSFYLYYYLTYILDNIYKI